MSKYADIDYDDVKVITDKALLLEIDDVEQWVPLSVIDTTPLPEVGSGSGELSIQEWFAFREGLI